MPFTTKQEVHLLKERFQTFATPRDAFTKDEMNHLFKQLVNQPDEALKTALLLPDVAQDDETTGDMFAKLHLLDDKASADSYQEDILNDHMDTQTFVDPDIPLHGCTARLIGYEYTAEQGVYTVLIWKN